MRPLSGLTIDRYLLAGVEVAPTVDLLAPGAATSGIVCFDGSDFIKRNSGGFSVRIADGSNRVTCPGGVDDTHEASIDTKAVRIRKRDILRNEFFNLLSLSFNFVDSVAILDFGLGHNPNLFLDDYNRLGGLRCDVSSELVLCAPGLVKPASAVHSSE